MPAEIAATSHSLERRKFDVTEDLLMHNKDVLFSILSPKELDIELCIELWHICEMCDNSNV